MEDYGLVSIITPSYNSSQFIGETITSILSQTYQHWELLITDDCSKDNSVEVIKKYAQQDSRIKLLELHKNSGAGVARNNSIKYANGRFIAFCDSDDRWTPTKLAEQLSFMVNGGYSFTMTSYHCCDEKNIKLNDVTCPKKVSLIDILIDDEIGCLTAIYDAKRIGKFYMPTIRKRQDWCLWIDIIRKSGPAYGIQRPLAIYRKRNSSLSSNKINLLKYNYRVYHEFLEYNTIKSALFLGCLFLPHYFYKKIKQKILNKFA